MTGSERIGLLKEKLQAVMPEVKIKVSRTGIAVRGGGPVIAVGILRETAAEMRRAKLGIWIYTQDTESGAVLFEAVCAVLHELPCAVQKTERGETVQDHTTGYMRTDCTAEAEWDGTAAPAERLRFGAFEFSTVPESLQVKNKALLRETVGINGEETVEQVGSFRRRVTASGCFYGAEAEKTYEKLEEMFGEEHTLFLPGRMPFEAILDRLERKGACTGDRVEYVLGFTETAVPAPRSGGRTYYAKGGESLWDYAYFTGVPIDVLMRKNPDIGHIGRLEAGEAVYIP